MPVQRFGSVAMERPAGLVPPPVDLSGVTELRLHGVGGAPPEQLLGDLAPQQVSGDRIAGFYRTADARGRHIEAYSWGGLTSHSGTRVLWVLLLPFALANVAGWMCSRTTHRGRWRFRLHRAAVRWASLGLTGNLLLVLMVVGADLVGYQCGGPAGCADRWWLAPLRWGWVADHPGRRVLLGALLPLAALVVLAVLSLRSIRRYEKVPPPLPEGERLPGHRHGAAQPGSGLADRGFWHGRSAALDLGFLHLAAGLAVVALVVVHTARTAGSVVGAPVTVPAVGLVGMAGGGAVLAGTLVLSGLDGCPRWLPAGLLVGAAGGLGCAGWFAAAQPAFATLTGENLPGLRNAANLGFAAIFGTLVLVLGSTSLGGRTPGGFSRFGPFLALALGVATLNVILLASTASMVRLLGGELAVYPVVEFTLPYLVLVPLGVGFLFGLYQLWTIWRAGRSWTRIRDWYASHLSAPLTEPQWWTDALAGAGARRWATRVARARRLAELPREADRLLAAITVVGVAILLAVEVRVWLLGAPVWETAWTRTLSAYLGIGLPLLVVLLLRSGSRSLEHRRRIGVLWDIFTFWPRAYHPLAPPSYAERAVPELQRRLWRIHDSGGRVVLAAHSQGSVIAAAALVQPAERPPNGDRVAMVSFGSPLGTLYRWAFPAYFDDQVLRWLVPAAGSGVELAGWRSFHYRTDYVGRAVFEPPADPGVDLELPDPPTCWHIFDQPAPRPGSHSGYWSDPAVWREVDRFAAALAPAGTRQR
jgi:hypothetical protein